MVNRIRAFIHTFITPNEDNNYRARALHTDFLSLYLVVAIVLAFTFKSFGANVRSVLGFATDITVNKLYELTNSERSKYNLEPLVYNEQLADAAKKKAQNMFQNNYWSHYGPNGETPWEFILNENYQYEYAGENLAKNFLFSKGVVDAWMNSESHRENILRKEYTEIGFAVVNGILNGEETTLVVQMFGKAQGPGKLTKREEKLPLPQLPQPNGNVLKSQAPNNLNLAYSTFPFKTTLAFFGFLMAVLAIDLYIASKANVFRVTGKSVAHFIFIGFVVVSLFIVIRGNIL